jgi:hypothetical protein
MTMYLLSCMHAWMHKFSVITAPATLCSLMIRHFVLVFTGNRRARFYILSGAV